MHKLESIRENEAHKILWDFKIQTDPPKLIQKTNPSVNHTHKRENLPSSGFCCFSGSLSENKKAKRLTILGPCQKTRKAMQLQGDGDTNYSWRALNSSKRLEKGSGRVGNQRSNRDRPVYSIVEIGQNTQKSPGDTRKLVVTQTPFKDSQPTLVGKTRKEWYDNCSSIRLCSDKKKTIYYINQLSKLAQKEFRNSHNLVRIVIHWGLI